MFPYAYEGSKLMDDMSSMGTSGPPYLIEYELSSADFFAEAQWVIYVAGYLVFLL
jgi:hypothetical protein